MKDTKKVIWRIVIIIGVLILLDQITKIMLYQKNMEIIPGILNFATVENRGGAFGVGQNNLGTFIITNMIVLGIIIRFMITQAEQIDAKTNFALCMVLAGGMSNLIDRLIRGFVVDFIDISPWFSFPKFNLADIYITVGWVLLAAFFAAYTWREVKRKKDEAK